MLGYQIKKREGEIPSNSDKKWCLNQDDVLNVINSGHIINCSCDQSKKYFLTGNC